MHHFNDVCILKNHFWYHMYDILTRIWGCIIHCIYTCSVVCIVEIKICKKKGKFVMPPPPQIKIKNIVKMLLNIQLALKIWNTTTNKTAMNRIKRFSNIRLYCRFLILLEHQIQHFNCFVSNCEKMRWQVPNLVTISCTCTSQLSVK